MTQKSSLIISIVITVALTFVGCNRKAIYSRYHSIPIDGWDKNDTVSFCVVPISQDGKYREIVGLRINKGYPFTGLSLIVDQQTASSGLKRSDTVYVHLMEYDGTVHGNGVILYQYDTHLLDLDLVGDDTLYVKVRHNMKRETVPGISDVGITLSELKDN